MALQANTKLQISKPIAEVFEHIVNPEKMSNYFISSGSARLETGKTLTWKFSDLGTISLEIKVLKIEPNQSISYLWKASGVETQVNINLESQDSQSTLVKVTESEWDFDENGVARCIEQSQGWMNFLCCLKASIEHGISLRSGVQKTKQELNNHLRKLEVE